MNAFDGPGADLEGLLSRLGLSVVVPTDHNPVAEAADLVEVGPDAFGREAKLAPEAAQAWQQMCLAAAADGVQLLLVSAFRSYAYQAGLWEKKLRAGETTEEIKRVLGVPGFSQHHTGRAVDIGAPACTDLSEAFERTAEFEWLRRNAGRFGFTMPFTRNNEHGVAYEPWHWFHRDGFILDSSRVVERQSSPT